MLIVQMARPAMPITNVFARMLDLMTTANAVLKVKICVMGPVQMDPVTILVPMAETKMVSVALEQKFPRGQKGVSYAANPMKSCATAVVWSV